jgi:hypothetical protein
VVACLRNILWFIFRKKKFREGKACCQILDISDQFYYNVVEHPDI